MRITLLTDFGTADGYVAAMKGVIASIAPGVPIDDATHEIPPGDVAAGAWALGRYWDLYPEGTIHVAVVDPGVGTARRAVAARIGGRYFVAPDNGILTWVLDSGAAVEAVEITEHRFLRDVVSATFHGRDVFAPVAAHLAVGARLDELGSPIHDLVRLDIPRPERTPSGAQGSVIHVDRFGNLITNIPGSWAGGTAMVLVAGREVGPVRRAYGDVRVGELLALVGSAGVLEISVRDGNAAVTLGVGRGARVQVQGVGRGEA